MTIQWLIESIEKTGTAAQTLRQSETDAVIGSLYDRFADPSLRHEQRPLWEVLQSPISRHRSDGWSILCAHVGEDPLLLIHEDEYWTGLAFQSGADIRLVLAECPGIEFYVTNRSADFVLCHNHHDYLIGAGASVDWIASVPSE
jgi:hypothetical protein